MNYVIIKSGLGNQMFQYALFLSLNSKMGGKGIRVFLPKIPDHNGYELERVFGINAPTDLWSKLTAIPHSGRIYLLFRKFHKDFSFVNNFLFEEKIFRTTHHNTLFDGFWQSFLYFQDIEDIVRKAFQFKTHLLSTNSISLANDIQSHNSVSVHIRRGDYMSSTFINTLGAVCDIQYYQNAIKYIKEKVDNPKFYFFSDDIEWVKANIPVGNAYYVNFNHGSDSWQDMYLMSCCKHNIIANSSFSWWGAWLNNNTQKIVVAPKGWWPPLEKDDVIPPKWIRL